MPREKEPENADDGQPEDSAPEEQAEVLPLVPQTRFGMVQLPSETLRKLQAKTPESAVDTVNKRGGNYKYVKHQYVNKKLNEIFYGIWSWEIVEWKVYEEINQVVAVGRLKVMMDGGIAVSKDAFGSADIMRYKKDHKTKPEQIISIGDALKSADSNALKKAASRFGIAGDVFGWTLEETHIGEDGQVMTQSAKVLSDEDFEEILKFKEGLEASKNAKEVAEVGKKIKDAKINGDQRVYLGEVYNSVISDLHAK